MPALGALDLLLDLLGDVVAGGERAPGAGEDDDLHLVVLGRLAPGFAQPPDDLAADRVQLARAVERHPGRRAATFVQDHIAHECSFQ